MAASKHKNLLSALKQFHNELKSYKSLLDHLAESKMILGHETRDRDKLRERLVRKTGVLKERIIELTDKQYFVQFMSKYDMWNEAFNPASFLPSPSNRTALAFCITTTNEAIGKLESDIQLGIRDEQGKMIEKPHGIDTEETTKDTAELPIQLFDKMQLHPKVIEASRELFKDGHYRDAIYRAFVEVNNFVKGKANSQLDGRKLMSTVFSLDNPIIKLNSLKTQSDKDEQEGFMFLFMGAMEGIRNPKAHENIIRNDPYRTLEYLGLASLLMKISEEGKLVETESKEHSS